MLILAALLALRAQQVLQVRRDLLPNPDGPAPRLMVWEPDDRLETPKLSPKRFGESKTQFEFDFVTSGFAQTADSNGDFRLRFRVFQQEKSSKNDLAPRVARMLLRLWEYNYWKLKLDHYSLRNQGIVDYYLCWGGTPGGEQLIDVDEENGARRQVNTIYIYDIASFTDPMEMAREVAHEYGHATLPPIGGFVSPEDWGNGYLGERLFLSYLKTRLDKGELSPDDAMGATRDMVDKWVAKNVDPLVADAAAAGPANPLLSGNGPASMDAYMGLNLYASQLLPASVFSRSLLLVGSTSAKDIPAAIAQAVAQAVEARGSLTLSVPPGLIGHNIWVPADTAALAGVPILKKTQGWIQICPSSATLTLTHSH